MQARKIRLGNWELQHHILRPARCLLQRHCTLLLEASRVRDDVTLLLTADHPPQQLTLPRSVLASVPGPLRTLVSGPFRETSQRTIPIHESIATFAVVADFLNCQPIRMHQLPPELPLVADRWGLITLYDAWFAHAEERRHPHPRDVPAVSAADLLRHYLPVMRLVPAPKRFRKYLALRLALEMTLVDQSFEQEDEAAETFEYDACAVAHEEGVACRRRRSQHPSLSCCDPSTLVEAPEVPPLPKPVALEPGAASEPAPPDEHVPEPSPSNSVYQQAMAPSDHNCNVLASRDTQVVSNDVGKRPLDKAAGSGATGNPEELGSSSTRCANGHAAATTSILTSPTAQSESLPPVAGSSVSGELNSSSPLADGTEQAQPEAGTPAPDPTSTTAEAIALSGSSDDADDLCYEDDDDDVDDENVSADDIGEGSHANGTMHAEDSSSRLQEAKDTVDDTPVCPIEALIRPWHKRLDIWRLFYKQRMLKHIIYYVSRFAKENYTPLLLDVVLYQLEPILTDEEILELLRETDWEWELPHLSVLKSKRALKWPGRSWRLLTYSQVGSAPLGSDVRMSWECPGIFGEIGARLREIAWRQESADEDNASVSSHSGSSDEDDEQRGMQFVKQWTSTAQCDGLTFGMRIKCSDIRLDHLTQLQLRVWLIEGNTPLDKRDGERVIASEVRTIAAGCGCDLGTSLEKGVSFRAKRGSERMEELWDFRGDGVGYRAIDPARLKKLIETHTRKCGLVFHVRLHVFPPDGDDSEGDERYENENSAECVCGFCRCDGCDAAVSSSESTSQSQGGDAGGTGT